MSPWLAKWNRLQKPERSEAASLAPAARRTSVGGFQAGLLTPVGRNTCSCVAAKLD